MTKMMRVLAAGAAVCSASALYAIEWGADNVAVLDVAGATETLSGNQAVKGVKVTAANVTLAAEDYEGIKALARAHVEAILATKIIKNTKPL